MKSTALLILCLLAGFSLTTEAQIRISGKVTQSNSSQGIAYANIGIINTEIGTISNEDGSFSISIPATYSDQNLLFSSIGFTQKIIPVASLQDKQILIIHLDEKVFELRTIYVTPGKTKKKLATLGNGKSFLLSGQLHCDTASAGSAMALLIDKSNYPDFTHIQTVSLFIAANKFPTFKIRLRILAVDSTDQNKPGFDLLNQQVIAVSDIQKGWLQFDLPNTFQINEKAFYLVFEWILDATDLKYITKAYDEYIELYPDRVSYKTNVVQGDTVEIAMVNKIMAGTVFGTTPLKDDQKDPLCFYRTNSFGEWKRASDILSAKIELANYH